MLYTCSRGFGRSCAYLVLLIYSWMKGERFTVYSDEFIAVRAHQIGIAAAVGTETLLKALSLYLSSDFVTYQQFFTSSQWGISTSIATLDSLKNLPVPLDKLSQQELSTWAKLRDTLAEVSRRYQRLAWELKLQYRRNKR